MLVRCLRLSCVLAAGALLTAAPRPGYPAAASDVPETPRPPPSRVELDGAELGHLADKEGRDRELERFGKAQPGEPGWYWYEGGKTIIVEAGERDTGPATLEVWL